MHFSRATAGILSAHMLCAAALTAAQANNTAGGKAGEQPQTVLRTQATSVLVDVVVSEKGQSVRGVDRKRFHILEDGHEQTITFLEEHSPNAVAPLEKRRPLPPHLYTNLPSQPTGSAVNVLLLDALNTPMADQMQVRKRMVEYIQTIPPGTTMAIFTLASRLRMVQGFTNNVGDLIEALKSARANPQQSVALDSTAGSATGSEEGNVSLIAGAGPALASLQAFQADMDSSHTDQRAALTVQALENLARYLSAVPGRKNLIWFSGSFPIVLGPDTVANPANGSRNYSEAVRNASQMLAAARVAVYPMAAEGLATLAAFDVGNSGLGPAPRDPDLQNRFTMEEIAQQTGGTALFNNNDFGTAVTKAIDDGANYYTIGYVPQSHDYHGQFRKLKVRIDDCDCHLSYRSGYYADSPDAPAAAHLPAASMMTAATLHGAPPATQVLFQTRVLPASDPQVKDAKLPTGQIGEMASSLKPPLDRFIVDVAVDARTLLFREDNSSHVTALEFTLVAYDQDGKRLNYVDRDAQLSLDAEQYAKILDSGLPVRLAIDSPAGRNFLVIAVHDRVGARVGSLEVPLEAR